MIKTLSLRIGSTKYRNTYTIQNSSLKKSVKRQKLPKVYANGLLLLLSMTLLPRRSVPNERLLAWHKVNLILSWENSGKKRQNLRR